MLNLKECSQIEASTAVASLREFALLGAVYSNISSYTNGRREHGQRTFTFRQHARLPPK